jgi:hypothetical protein
MVPGWEKELSAVEMLVASSHIPAKAAVLLFFVFSSEWIISFSSCLTQNPDATF